MIVLVASPGECCPYKSNMCCQGAGSIMWLPSFIEWLLAVCAQLVLGVESYADETEKKKANYSNIFSVEIDSSHYHSYQKMIFHPALI